MHPGKRMTRFFQSGATRRRTVGCLSSIFFILALLATSCGGGTTSPTPTTAAKAGTTPQAAVSPAAGTTAQAASTPAASGSAAKAQRGGKLRVAVTLDATSLDPHTGISGGDDYYWYAIFDNLVAYDQNFVLKPELSLAEKWDIPDPKTMVFNLRKGVKFHDGTPFNAQAVKVNIERVLDPQLKATPRSNFLVIDKVDVVDEYTVKFNLKQPSGALLSLLGGRGGTMISPAALEKYGKDIAVHPVGTGPFQFGEWVKGSYVTLKRNENYWAKDKDGVQLPYLEEVKINIIPDSTVRFANLQTGDIDLAFVDAKDLVKAKGIKTLGVQDFEGAAIEQLISYNLAKPPMDDLNARLAVAHAVDPDAINKAVYFGDDIIAKAGMWPVNTWVYDESVPRPFYDQKKAKEFLAKSKNPNGFTMNMVVYSDPQKVQAGEVIKAQLAEVGIKVNIEVRDVGQATAGMYVDQSFPIYSTGWSRYPEPDWNASLMFTSNGYYNAGKLKNEELDALVAKGAASYDNAERKKIYNEINNIVLNQAMVTPLLYARYHAGYNVKVQNANTLFGGEAKFRYKELWLK